MIIVDHLLKLSLIIIVLNLSIVIEASSHLMVLLLPSKSWHALKVVSLRVVFLCRSSSLVRLIINLTCLSSSKLLVSKLSIQLWSILGDF